MKLRSIQLCNFRQFYGKTIPILLGITGRNTTIIHGNNGAGKTTLLNAFTWVLYEKVSLDFEFSEQLVNKRAITEAQLGAIIDCWVEIGFEHDNKRYQAKRQCRVYKTEAGIETSKNELYLQIAGDDGRWTLPQQHPEDIIGRILPVSLHQYFFFNGERIDKIVRFEKKNEMAEATKTLLGIEVLNRSVKHLKEAKKTLESELQLIGDIETRRLLKNKEKIEIEADQIRQRQGEIEQELLHQDELKKIIGARLLELSGAQELQKLRNELEAQKKSVRQELIQSKEILKRLISRQSYAVFLPDATDKFRQIVSELREKGELPTGIKRPFVQDLLNRQRCICGSELQEGSVARDRVQGWMDKAGVADIEETAIRMSVQVDELNQQVPEFWQEVDRLQAEIHRNRTELSRIETELDDLKAKLRNYPSEDIQNLQKRFDETDEKIRELTLEQGANQQKMENIKGDIEGLDKQIAKHQTNESKQELAQRRIAATQDAVERLMEVRSRLDNHFRAQLEKRVQEIFTSISFTPYLPKISEKYELTLVENTGDRESTVAASTGENQILSLSFIGGIIDRVREWSRRNTLMGPDSSTLPIVMDSPFGSLDEIYRRQIAKILPQLANQLVVLVTKTQWRGEVAQEMTAYIGKEYVLAYNSPKPDCEEDSIEIDGVRYPLVRQSPNEFEYTEIIEVNPMF